LKEPSLLKARADLRVGALGLLGSAVEHALVAAHVAIFPQVTGQPVGVVGAMEDGFAVIRTHFDIGVVFGFTARIIVFVGVNMSSGYE